jgi:Tol biopolymer transport system component
MIDGDEIERAAQLFQPRDDAYDRFTRHRTRVQRNRRLGTAALALALVTVALILAGDLFRGSGEHRPISVNRLTPPAALHGEVAFALGGNQPGRGWGLQVYEVTGQGRPFPITSTRDFNNEPEAWSPDGKELVVQRAFGPDRGEDLFLYRPGGGRTIRLTNDPTFEGEAHFSPDGTRIAFIKGSGLDVMNSDGTGVRQLAGLVGSETSSSFSWSPDGSRIALAQRTQPARYDDAIKVVDVQSGHLRKISSRPGQDCVRGPGGTACDRYEDPQWSPNGANIAVTRITVQGTFRAEIYVMRSDGSGMEPVTGEPGRPSTCLTATWSPDGSRLAVTCRWGVYVMRPDGGGITHVAGPGFQGATWSPDGSEIGLWRAQRLYIAYSNGSGLSQLTTVPGHEFDLPLWKPAG